MNADYESFVAKAAEKIKDRQRGMLPQAHALHAAAVSMENLTHHEHWDRFLSLIQGLAETTRGQRDAALQKLADPVLSDDQVRKLRMDIREAEGMLSAFKVTMELPKAIHDGGEKAVELINKFEQVNDRSPAAETPQP